MKNVFEFLWDSWGNMWGYKQTIPFPLVMGGDVIDTGRVVQLLAPYCARVDAQDSSYVRPDREWWTDFFFPFYTEFNERINLANYGKRHDCDNFAITFWDCAMLTWARTPEEANSADAQSIACGVCKYAEPGHVVNFVLLPDDTVAFIEPQTPAFFTPAPESLASIYNMFW